MFEYTEWMIKDSHSFILKSVPLWPGRVYEARLQQNTKRSLKYNRIRNKKPAIACGFLIFNGEPSATRTAGALIANQGSSVMNCVLRLQNYDPSSCKIFFLAARSYLHHRGHRSPDKNDIAGNLPAHTGQSIDFPGNKRALCVFCILFFL